MAKVVLNKRPTDLRRVSAAKGFSQLNRDWFLRLDLVEAQEKLKRCLEVMLALAEVSIDAAMQ